MTMYNIINCMKASGQDFNAMCIFASAISNAIWVAKGEQMPRNKFTYEQRVRRFCNYVGDLFTLQRMWNATRPDKIWEYEDLRRTEKLLNMIWYRYN